MKEFMNDDFLLRTKTASRLYHEYAAVMPIYDYHCHLPVREIAEDRKFENLTKLWLTDDHYKWRAMRCCGIPEKYITGNASDEEKFAAWARTVPKTLRNPLYHWTHLELKHPFGIKGILLDSETGEAIYKQCNDMLATDDFSVRSILKKMQVGVICTTDDPLDDLRFHGSVRRDSGFEINVLPTFRPDKAIHIDNPEVFNEWTDQLQQATKSDLQDFESFMAALENRLRYFHREGCRISDHGIGVFRFNTATPNDLNEIYRKARQGTLLNDDETTRFKSQVLIELGKLYAKYGWVQQFHLGPLRNINTRMFQRLGPDTGYDSMGDQAYAEPLSGFLDHLDQGDQLAKTILYTINPKDNEMLATMIGSFQDGNTPGKVQFGSAWWFNDQKDGMERQLNALSTMGILSQFVGMLTDSRSFLSFSRHEYFRRILCNLLGNDVENGELPDDPDLIGGMVQDICFNNACRYFDQSING